eukprot:sb/3465686/
MLLPIPRSTTKHFHGNGVSIRTNQTILKQGFEIAKPGLQEAGHQRVGEVSNYAAKQIENGANKLTNKIGKRRYELRVLTATGTNPAAHQNVSTAPHLAASLWRNVEVEVGGIPLIQSYENAYGMFKFWDDIIHTSHDSKPLSKRSEGLLLDSVGDKDESENLVFYPTTGSPKNASGQERAKGIEEGKKVYLRSEFNIPLFKQGKLLPSEGTYHVKLTKNDSGYILLAADTNTDEVHFNKFLLVCVQDRNALIGNKRSKNPFSLRLVKSAQLYVNGKEHFPRALEMSDHLETNMLAEFVLETGSKGDSLVCHHYRVYPALAFDLTQDKTQNQHGLNLGRSGNASLSLEMLREPTEDVVVIVLAWYEQIIEVNKNRQFCVV